MLERIFQEPRFRVCCLGAIKLIEAGSGTDMTPATRKTRALLGYLCIVGKPVGRERLASLLWGDRGDEQARASLRQAIYELRSLLGGDHLLKIERDTVSVGDEVGTDVAAIMAAAQSGNLEQLCQSLSEWRGDFFEDLPSIDPSFDSWLQSERLRVQESLVEAAAEAVKSGMARGEIDATRRIVNLLQQHDGTNELVLRLGLRLDHLAGDSAALHRRYERFRELLKSELDAAPAGETRHLFDELATKSPPPDLSIASRSGARAVPAADIEKPASPHPVRSGHGLKIAAVAAVILAVALAFVAWQAWKPARIIAAPGKEPLLAVLPFQNLGADSGSRYFSDGITGEIIDALLRTTQIRVVSPNASFRFRNTGSTKAAKALAATHVLTGSVQRDGDRIHLIAELTDTGDNAVIWSHTYDREIAQSPALQRDIAVQIADSLDMRLSPNSRREAQQISPTAYDHYLKGRDLFLQRDLEGASTEMEASTRLAPNFAKAWSTLAALRMIRISYTYAERKEDDDPSMRNAAREAAQRALALDPNNGEALAVLGDLTLSTHLLDIDRLYERAIRSEPNNTQLLNWDGVFLAFVGRNREGLEELTRAYEIDRITPSIASNLAEAYLETGRYGEAWDLIGLARDNRLQSIFFELHVEYFLFRHDWSGLANYLNALPDYLPPREAQFARQARETALVLAVNAADKIPPLRASWRNAASFEPVDVVQFLFALGDTDGALQFVQAAVAEHRRKDHYLVDPGWDALFPANLAPLRRDPRVPQMFAQWGLFDYWRSTNHWPDFCYEPGLPFDCKTVARKLMQRAVPVANGKRL